MAQVALKVVGSDNTDKQKALEYYTQAIALHRLVQNDRQLATTLKNVGVFHRDEGQIPKALEYLNEARTLSANVGDRDTEASVLSEIAKIELARGDLLSARKLIEQAIAQSESVRINLKSQSFRASYLASVRKYYEFEIEVLMRLHQQRPNEGFDAAAIEVSEKSRARSLLELLHEARAQIDSGGRAGRGPQRLRDDSGGDRYMRPLLNERHHGFRHRRISQAGVRRALRPDHDIGPEAASPFGVVLDHALA